MSEGEAGFLRDFQYITKVLILFSHPFWGTNDHFTRVTVHWGKGNDETIHVLLDTGSELTLIPQGSKCHCGPSVRIGTYEGQVI